MRLESSLSSSNADSESDLSNILLNTLDGSDDDWDAFFNPYRNLRRGIANKQLSKTPFKTHLDREIAERMERLAGTRLMPKLIPSQQALASVNLGGSGSASLTQQAINKLNRATSQIPSNDALINEVFDRLEKKPGTFKGDPETWTSSIATSVGNHNDELILKDDLVWYEASTRSRWIRRMISTMNTVWREKFKSKGKHVSSEFQSIQLYKPPVNKTRDGEVRVDLSILDKSVTDSKLKKIYSGDADFQDFTQLINQALPVEKDLILNFSEINDVVLDRNSDNINQASPVEPDSNSHLDLKLQNDLLNDIIMQIETETPVYEIKTDEHNSESESQKPHGTKVTQIETQDDQRHNDKSDPTQHSFTTTTTRILKLSNNDNANEVTTTKFDSKSFKPPNLFPLMTL